MTDADDHTANPRKRPRIFEDKESEFFSPAYSKAPWTASRCYRLLRPIESKIGVLRKAKGKSTNTADDNWEKRRQLDNGASVEREDRPGAHISSDEENSSPLVRRRDVEGEGEWVPNPSKLRGGLKHSYKYGRLNKNRKPTVGAGLKPGLEENTPPGQLTLPTPFILKYFGPGQKYGAGIDRCGAVEQTPGILCERDMNAEGGARKRQRLQGSWEVHNARCPSLFNEKPQRATESHLVKDLSQLLYATNSSAERSGGSRSLLSMCLRKLPSVIRQEQKKVDELEPEEGYDVSTYIYNYLESEYSLTYGSWKPLRELVRAQGVDILCNGIRDGLIPADVSKMLYLATRKSRAARESGQILDAIVSVQRAPIAPPTSSGSLLSDIPGLGLLDKDHVIQFTTGDKRTLEGWDNFSDPVGNILNQLAHLILRDVLPLEWVAAADMNTMLKVAIRSIARGDKHTLEAFRLVETTLGVAIGVGNEAVSDEIHAIRMGMMDKSQKAEAQVSRPVTSYATSTLPATTQTTISNLIAVITATEILQLQQNSSGNKTTSCPRYTNPMIHRLSVAIQQRCELDSSPPQQQSPRSSIRVIEAGQVLLGQFLLVRLSSNAVDSPLLETFAKIVNSFHSDTGDISTFETAMARFIDDVVRVCGRAHVDQGFALLQQIVTFMTLSVPSLVVEYFEVQSFFGKVAIDSAMAFAERVARKECFEWAASVSKSMGEGVVLGRAGDRSPAGRSKSDGPASFIWDDAICEWVQEIAMPRPVAFTVCCGARTRRISARTNTSAASSSCASANISEAKSLASYSTSGGTNARKRATVFRATNERAPGTNNLSHATRRLHSRQHQRRHQRFQPRILQSTRSEDGTDSQPPRPRPSMKARLPAPAVLALTACTDEQAKSQDEDGDSDELDELSSNLIVVPSSLLSREVSAPVLYGPMEKWRPRSRVKKESVHSVKREAENESENDELSFDMVKQKPERKFSGNRPENRDAILVDEGSSEDELFR